MILMILGVYWGATFVNLFGLKLSSLVSSVGVISGTIFPTVLMSILGLVWWWGGHSLEISMSFDAMMPDLTHIRDWVFLAGLVLTFGGMEVSAVNASEVINPTRTYPRAILLSLIIVMSIFIFGSLALAFVVPPQDISLVAGVMQAFTYFFDQFHMRWAIRVMAFLVAVGTLAEIVTWIIEPSRGIYIAGTQVELPKFFHKLNRHGVQARILIIQGCIVTALSLIFFLMPTVNSSYWILTALTAQLYLIMYILMFIEGIRLRYSKPKVKRAYKIPCGNFGMWVVGMTGIASCLGVIGISFFPPVHVDIGSIVFFELFLGIGLVVTCAVPFIINHFKNSSWKMKSVK